MAVHIKREAVQSSQIKSVGYEPISRKLHIEFHGRGGAPGRVAEYDDVSADKHAALMASDSKGRHFAMHIRGKKTHSWRYV